VLRIVFVSMLGSIGAGVAIGLLLSVSLNKVMAHWSAVSQTGTPEPLLLSISTLTLMLVAALACLLPARRAAAVEPITAIRYE
jgi:ABC-type antimicrobial peptide transport system permease subunit